MMPGDHVALTRKAIELFSRYSSSASADKFEQYAKQVIKGSRTADFLPVRIRLTHWHFFRENEKLKPKRIQFFPFPPCCTIYPTSEHILRRRIEQLRREIARKNEAKTFSLTGRILHHVQDMTTPAHVVPVFHGGCVRDSFEEFSGDNIENYLDEALVSRADCDGIAGEAHAGLTHIYKNAARSTLQHLCDPESRFDVIVNGETRRIGWDSFWERYGFPRSERSGKAFCFFDGFGRYGVLGKHFGEEEVRTPLGNYVIPVEVYETFFRCTLKKILLDSLRTFFCVDRLLEN
jgi:hypothetical protein